MKSKYPNNLIQRVIETYDPLMDRLDAKLTLKQIQRNRQRIDNVIDDTENERISKLINESLAQLNDRERSILLYRNKDAYKLRECAEIYNISKERVRQIEYRAYTKLQEPDIVKAYITMFYKGDSQ